MKGRFAYLLFAAVAIALILGLVTLNSAAMAVSGGDNLVTRQWIWLGLGLLLGTVVYLVNYRVWMEFAPLIYGGVILLLLLVLVFGEVIHGSRSWLVLAGARIQPSEPAKFAVLLMAAWLMKADKAPILGWSSFLKLGLIFGIPTGLILIQPDFGTASTLAVMGAVVFFVLGMRFRIYLLMFLLIIGSAYVGWNYTFKPYQKERVLTFFNPERDPLGRGYHVIQSKVAVGSGRIFGRGYRKGTQSKLRYLPEPHTDFIFAVYAEEFGFAGVALALTVLFMIVSRMINVARVAYDKPGMVIAMGAAGLLFYQIVVSTGMIVGLIPTTGIPLPFFSYGGSATITYMMLVALVMNVFRNRFERM